MSIETAEELFKKYDGHVNLLRKNEPSSYAILSAACLSNERYNLWRKDILEYLTRMGTSDIYNVEWFNRFVRVSNDMSDFESYRFDCLVDLLRAYANSDDVCKIEILRRIVGTRRFGFRDGLLYWVLKQTDGFSVMEAIMQQEYVSLDSNNSLINQLSRDYKDAVYRYV